jgi:hypothetical protein
VIEVGTNPSSLTIGGTALTATAAELNTLDGITATTAELNTLDGITATVTELNYTDGVTSNIQTQLNTKAPIASPTFTGTVTAPAVNVNGTVTADGLTVDGDSEFINNTGSTVIVGTGTSYSSSINGVQFRDRYGVTGFPDGQITGFIQSERNLSTVDFDLVLGSSTGGVDAVQRLRLESNGDISFYEDTGTTAKLFWDASAESLGIGTTNPFGNLEINGGGYVTAGGTLIVRQRGDTNADGIALTSSNVASHRIWKDASGNLNIGSSSAPSAFVQDVSGRVGIGTTSPVSPLHILNAGTTAVSNAIANSGVVLDGGSGNIGLNLVTPDTGAAYINFGDSTDSNVGRIIYNHNTNALTFDTNGSEVMRIDSSGNLLVGKTVVNTAAEGVELRESGKGMFTASATDPVFVNRLTSDGDIIKLAKDNSTVGSIGTLGGFVTMGKGDTGLIFRDSFDDITPFNLSTNSYQDATIDLGTSGTRFKDLYLSGASYHGTTSDTIWTNTSGEGVVVSNDAIQVARSSGTALFLNRMTTTGKIQTFSQAGTEVGNVTVTASATAYNTSSDYRLKENVVSMDNASDRVLALNPVRFNFITDPEKTVDGFLAHEAQAVVPEAVHGVKDEVDDEGKPVYQGIDQSKLVPLLTKALQEALERIAVLESKVGA